VDIAQETVTKADLKRIDALMMKAYEVIEVQKNYIQRLETQASDKEIGVVKSAARITPAANRPYKFDLGAVQQDLKKLRDQA
jgi:hypothetical protein